MYIVTNVCSLLTCALTCGEVVGIFADQSRNLASYKTNLISVSSALFLGFLTGSIFRQCHFLENVCHAFLTSIPKSSSSVPISFLFFRNLANIRSQKGFLRQKCHEILDIDFSSVHSFGTTFGKRLENLCFLQLIK
jgi:hypothetical protein